MSFLFDTLEEFDEEITFVRTQMRNAVKSTEFMLDTSQSRHKVVMDLNGIRKYLNELTIGRKAFIERSVGAGVTSLTYRRCS